MKKGNILFIILVIPFLLQAQDRLGLKLGDYAGINGVHLNPASISNSRYYLDVNIAGSGIFVNNNYVYLPKENYSPTTFLKENPTFPTFNDEHGNKRYLDEWYNKDLKDGYINLRALGPSAMVAYGRHAFGFYSSARSMIRSKGVPYEVAKLGYEDFDYDPLFNVNFINEVDMHLEVLNMAEVGVTYSNIIFARNFDKLDVGMTFKYLKPHSGMKFYTDNVDYLLPNNETLRVFDMNGQVRMALPVNYDNNNFPDNEGLFKGHGLGFDLGLVYTKTKSIQRRYDRFNRLCRQRVYDYDYRIGVSLLDVGYVNFNRNVQVHRYENASVLWENLQDFNFENTNQVMEEVSKQFFDDPQASNTGEEEFTLALPSALSAQFDYHFRDNWYVNSSLIYGLNSGANGYNRPHNFAVTPRYQTDYFGVNLPVSLYNFRQPRVGLSARVYFLTVGTSNIGHYLGATEMNGMDFYVSVKFNFLKGKCGRGRTEGCRGQEYGVSTGK
ncbi:MAG: DUF5723 family protein [Bacteroidales bacterium]|nr:DUF5723 family protein [Bacteroidales bacterium]MCF8334472.1 DUF5723 family protein [Bacteroidales bacterium]